ncbi:response regulator [Paucidesulfovibrio longus]|uniref:response regulator n=1 Tax=Paucidesulfovibrio longus TaxID=889 RepID=UPI0003B581D3|nr:response regulator [Paucidesulfovibrio longus]
MDKKLLLVDDEDGLRRVLGISLTDIGYEVHTASNAEEALERFQALRAPIVLTDIKMPGMDGLELLQAIKAIEPETEVIMITGHGDMNLAIASLKLDATDFITKPINHDALEVALKRAEDRIAMRRQLREHTENLERLVAEKSAKLLHAERRLATRQVLEGLTEAMGQLTTDVDAGESIFNELPCFVSVHNAYLEIIAINQHYRDRLGDFVGANSWDAYCDRKPDDEECPVGKTFRTGKGQRSREILTGRDGSDIPVIVHTAPIKGVGEDADVELVLEISVDVQEVNRLQEELRQSRERYRQLFDAVPCYITVQDRDFKLVEANRRFLQDFGGDPGELCHAVFKGRSEPCRDCPVAKTFADGETHESEEIVTTLAGERFNVLVQTAPILDAAGRVEQVMELSTDITQIRRLQDHLTNLGLLLGTVSHGVKGLLTALDGGIYRVDSGFKKGNEKQVQAGWKVVRQMVGRIRAMVLDILYYAKKRDLRWERVDALEFANQVADIAEAKAQDNGISFIRDFAPDLGEFEVDPGIVSSALVNLLENAVDACLMDKSGAKGEAGSAKDHVIRFHLSERGDDVLFGIEDNGMGMDQETRNKLFTLFFSSKGDRGTGLGLFMSNQIVEQHGGSIVVESEPGKGSRFTVRLPKVLAQSAKTSQTRETESGQACAD